MSAPSTSFEHPNLRSGLLLILAAVSAAAVAQNASAAIIYSGVQDLQVPQDSNGLWVDLFSESLTGGGLPGDLLLLNEAQEGVSLQSALTTVPGAFVSFSVNGQVYLTALSEGFMVSSSSVGPLGHFYGTMAAGAEEPSAQFNLASNKYIGLSFVRDTALYFAWVRVSINNSAGSFVVHDWAYENTGGGILTGAIPAPGALALLAAGGFLGLRPTRRRRR